MSYLGNMCLCAYRGMCVCVCVIHNMRTHTELRFFTGNTRSLDQRTNHLLITEHLNHEFQSPLSNSMKPEVTVHMQWNFITGEEP